MNTQKRFGKIHESFMLLEKWASGRHLLPDTTETDVLKAYNLALTDKLIKDKRKPTRTNAVS